MAEPVKVNQGYIIFGDRGFWALVGTALVSIWQAYYAISLVCVGLALIWIITRLWGAKSLHKLEITELVTCRELFPGESVNVELKVSNHKLLPVPWLRLEISDEKHILFNGEEGNDNRKKRFVWIFAGQPRHLTYVVTPKRRGVYSVGPEKISSGDPFAFVCYEQTRPDAVKISVFPHLLGDEWLDVQRHDPLGEHPDRNFLFTDPLLVSGITDYQPVDPIRKIDWIASARYQTLKSKIWEGRAAAKCTVVLETAGWHSVSWSERTRELAWELLLSSVATQSMNLATQNQKWSFFTDAYQPFLRQQGWYLASISDTYSQLRELLIMLAGMNQPEKIEDGPADLAVLSPGETVIVFCARVTQALAGTLEGLSRIRRVICKVLQLPEETTSLPFTVMELLPGWQNNQELALLLMGEGQEGGPVNEEALPMA